MQETASNRSGLSQEEALSLCRRILAFSTADQARVNVGSGWRGFTRVAVNRVTSAGGSSDVTVRVTSVFGQRVAAVTTNRLDDESLRQAVRDSEALARLAPENPEYLPELGPQKYADVNGYYRSTGELTPRSQAEAAALAIRTAREAGTVAAGFIGVYAGAQAVATSNGLFAYYQGTGAASTLTVRVPDGTSSGWAGDEAAGWDQIESERIASEAVRKCLDWRGSAALDPGKYTVILEPTAAGMLMLRLLRAFDARQADEGRSYFSKPGGGNRLGQKLFDAKVSISSDPSARDAETSPFTGEGLPVGAETWVEKGVLRRLAYSRFWAGRQGAEARPAPSNLILSGGNATLEDMIRSTRRGVLITRFWYIRELDPRTLSYTGLTRDGTFLIESGKISRPVNNFRFNQSLVELLNKVEMLGRPVRVAAGESSSVGTPMVVPPLKVRDFYLSSISDAV